MLPQAEIKTAGVIIAVNTASGDESGSILRTSADYSDSKTENQQQS
jgi:hypothetical protein